MKSNTGPVEGKTQASSGMTGQEWQQFIGYWGFYYTSQYHPINIVRSNPPAPGEFYWDVIWKQIRVIPTITMSGSIDRWVTVSTDMETYMKTSMDEFVTGRRPFSQWDAYITELGRRGLNEGVATVQKWYDNYWAIAGK